MKILTIVGINAFVLMGLCLLCGTDNLLVIGIGMLASGIITTKLVSW